MRPARLLKGLNSLLAFGLAAAAAFAQNSFPTSIVIQRATGPIVVDGDLSDEGWKGAERIETWYETNPGDNTPPPVKNVGYLTYDDKAFYAGFDFEDPEPRSIRAPLVDRDNVSSSIDYGA